MIELKEVTAGDGRTARTWTWLARYLASGLVLVAGLVACLVGLAV